MTTSMNLSLAINAVDNASAVISQVGSAIQQLASGNVLGAVTSVGQALVGIGTQAVQSASDFQTATTKIASYAGLSGQALKTMNTDLEQMATQVGQTPTQLAHALYPIVSSSYDASDALNILRLSAETAASSGANTTAVADGLTTALKAFNLPASQASNVMDVMNKTVSDGKMEFPQYAAVIGRVSLSASSARVTFDEMNATLATLTTHGFPSVAQAATATTNLYTQMGVKTGALATNAHKLGLSFNAQQYAADTLSQKIAYLNKITGGNQQEILKLLGGSTVALKAFNAMSGGAKDYTKDLRDNQKAQGTTAQIFANTSATFNQSTARLNAAFSVLMINLGNKFLPILTQLANAVTPIITAFANWVAGGGQVNGTIQQIGGILQSLFLPIWQQLVTLFQTQLVPLWFQLQTAIAPIMPQLQQAAMIVGGILYGSFVVLISIIRAVIGALSGLLTGAVLIVQGLVQTFQGGFQFIGGLIQFFVDLFTLKWNNLGTDLGNIAGGIVKMWQGMWTATEGVFVSAINGLIGLVNGFLQGIIGGINTVLTATGKAAIHVGTIPMLSAPAVASGNFGNLFTPTASKAQGVTSKTQAQSNAGLSSILSQLQNIGKQQGSQSLITQANTATTNNALNNLNNTTVPAAANTAAAATKSGHAKTAAQIAKAADTANAQRMRLATAQQKALKDSSSSAVQALVNQSKAAAAKGDTATAAVYASQADTLAAQQKSAATKAANTAKTAAHHQAVLAAAAARKAQATKHHADIMKAREAAAKAKVAAQAAKAAVAATRHKKLIDTIVNAANQVSGNTTNTNAVIAATAAGVILPDYATGTAYTAHNAQPQASATTVINNITVNSSTADPKEHGKKIAAEVNKHLARHLRGSAIAPRYTHGGTHK